MHVATDAARFDVAFHRWTGRLEAVEVARGMRGIDAPARTADVDWGWPAYPFRMPREWPPGVYVAHLVTPGGPPLSLALDSAAALFVLRDPRPGPLRYKLPVATYHAYNVTGGACFYHRPPRSSAPAGARVSLRRPGGGIGGDVFGAVDHYDAASPRQTFAHWDAPFIAWLYRNGYAPSFCTDLDVYYGSEALDARLLLQAGHDEYWTHACRDRVEHFVARGGNVAFFGANTCWWRIHVTGDDAIVCHQGGPRGALDHWWPVSGVHRPEDRLTGTSYRHGGGWWDGPREAAAFVVQRDGHWALAGTGLARGDRFGHDTLPPLAGYECDGVPIERIDDDGIAVLASYAGACGTPAGLDLVAVAPLSPKWQELPHREFHPTGGGVHAAVMATWTRGGTVFNAGTTDWAQCLGHPVVDRITRNVLDRLLA